MAARRTGCWIGLLIALGSCGRSEPMEGGNDSPYPRLTDAQLAKLTPVVMAELRTMNALTTDALVGDAMARRLMVFDARESPYSPDPQGQHSVGVSLALEPKGLPVPTEISLGFSLVIEPSGEITVLASPSRDDLVAAVKLALETQDRALAAAVAALDEAGAVRPAKFATWPAALTTARLDPRLPREKLYGEPSWQFILEPWSDEHGGWQGVLLDARTMTITSVTAHPPARSKRL